jgi:hypothetical protein
MPTVRTAGRYVAVLVLAAVVVALLVPSSRIRVFRGAGWFLVCDDPLETVDAVVVTADAGEAGVLEAADLVHRRVAVRVALLSDSPTPAQREFARRGLDYEDTATAAQRYLKLLGVSEVERIPSTVDGTQAEGRVLREWCVRRQLRSVVVVSTADHSRRLRRVLRRSMRGSPTRALVRSSRFSQFDPDSWWLTRTGVRTQLVETEKLLLDMATHPVR